MSNNAPDYKDNLVFEPKQTDLVEYINTVKSQDELPEQGRKSDVLIKALEKCEKLEKENKEYYSALMQISYLTPALGGDKEDMEKSLLEINDICDWALRPEEMEEMKKMYEELDK